MPQKDDYQHKPWLKLWSRQWLDGSLRFLTLEERGLWADLLAMANESRNRGVIQANSDMPYPHSWIATKLNVPLGVFERILTKFKDEERVSENNTGIIVINFAYYQDMLARKRGRPRKHPSEQLDFHYYDAETRVRLEEAYEKLKTDLGRDPTLDEYNELKAEIVGESEGET